MQMKQRLASGLSELLWVSLDLFHWVAHSPNKAELSKPAWEIFMELLAIPRFLTATHIPRSVNGKIFIAADQDGSLKQQLMLCLAILHQETLNILTQNKQWVCHVPVDAALPSACRRFSGRTHQTQHTREGCWFRRKWKQRMKNRRRQRRKKKVRSIQHLWLWLRQSSGGYASATVLGRSCIFKMSAVISSGVVRLHNQAVDACRGEALRQHIHVYKHEHTPALFHAGITLTKAEVGLHKSCYCSAIQHKCTAQHYGLGREALKTNSALQVCFSACTGRSTCYVIREHMLLFSATSHSGSYRMRTENKCLKPKTTFVQTKRQREKAICD